MAITTPSTDIKTLPGLKSLWAETKGDREICIAILDGAVDRSHPCLREAQLSVLKTLSSNTEGGTASEHGTEVASIIFGQHNSAVSGIAPNCRGLILPIFSDGIDGSIVPCSQIDLARAITNAVEQGANIINISGGQLTTSKEAGHLLTRAVQLCSERNVVIVAAAGNDGCQCLHLPAAISTVLAVGATNAKRLPLNFSNWGDAYQTQGILALGENITAAIPGGGTVLRSGTSFATAIVSGIIALLLSLQIKQGKPDPQAVRAAILESALPCDRQKVADCSRYLAGILNLAGAIALITKPQTGVKTLSNRVAEETLQSVEAVTQEQLSPTSPIITSENVNPAAVSRESSLIAAPGNTMMVKPISTATISENTINVPNILPSGAGADCSCGGGLPPQLLYAIGTIDYDFGTTARRDSLVQDGRVSTGTPWNPNDPMELLDNLEQQPWEASSLIWTLNQEQTPIYAILPSGAYASKGYELLRQFLREQLTEGVERVSIPGITGGSVRLLSGVVVPVIIPSVRGMYSWSTTALTNSILGEPPESEAEQTQSYEQRAEGITNFLDRIYYELRNLGIIPQERAVNYAATNAFQIARVFEQAASENMQLDQIEVEISPLSRPESECYDVKLVFFDPEHQNQRARKVYRFTVDVSDVVPVTVGRVRSWSIY